MRNRCMVFFLTLVCLFLMIIPAYAYIPCLCKNPPDQCTCFIQLGDKGLAVERIIEKLKERGYLNKSSKKTKFTQEVKQAVIKLQEDHNLECTGWMDDETLDALLLGILPSEDEKHSYEYWDSICFVPTDGGKKHHSDPTCSGMYNPRMISRANARSLGIEPCGKNTCKKAPALTYTMLGLTPRSLPDSYYEDENSEVVAAMQRSLPSDDVEGTYIGNKNSHVFHRDTCSSVGKMNTKNKVSFSSREEAIEKGFEPCGKCNP